MSLSINKGEAARFYLLPETTCLRDFETEVFYLEFQSAGGGSKGFYVTPTVDPLNGRLFEFMETPTDDLPLGEIYLGNVGDVWRCILYQENPADATDRTKILEHRLQVYATLP